MNADSNNSLCQNSTPIRLTAEEFFQIHFNKKEQPMNNTMNTTNNNVTAKRAPRRLVRIKTITRANGRSFSVAIYSDGTTADLD